MPSFAQRSFAGGEIAPAAYGRADLVKYQTGLRICSNFFVRRHGGVSNRPGSMFICEQKSSAAQGRMLKFVFSSSQTYVLLFENLYMRVIKQGVLVRVSGVAAWGNTSVAITAMTKANPCVVTSVAHGISNGQRVTLGSIVGVPTRTITVATNANPCVITSVAHGFSNGTVVRITGVGGMTELNSTTPYTVASVTANTFELSGIDSSTFGLYTAGGNVFENGTNFSTLNGQRFTVASVTANTFELASQSTSGFSSYVSGGTATVNYQIAELATRLGVNYTCILEHANQQPPNATYWYALTGDIYEIPTPYVTADLGTLYSVQSGDIVTIVHPNYGPRNLARAGDTTWTLSVIVFDPDQAKPTGGGITGTVGAVTAVYHVTAVAADTFEESEALIISQINLVSPSTVAAPHTVSWTAATGAQEYNIYFVKDGVPGLVGTAIGTSFVNAGITPDDSLTPPQARAPFTSAGNYPSTVGYFQQRRIYGNTNNKTEKIWTSKSGFFDNFGISSPMQDDDGVTFSIAGRQVNEVRHLVDIGNFILMTEGGEWVAEGNGNGVLTPTGIGLKQHSYNGSAEVPPVIIGNNLLYVQARGGIVRDLRYEFATNGYSGNDLTVFAAHLFEGYTITHWDYAQIPHSIVWAVRSDGQMVGLTYLREHEIWGWHKHDTDGTYEDVVVVPEGNEDAIYVLVKRTINGTTKRYVERFASRQITDVTIDAKFSDSFLSWDGRNSVIAPTTTMRLTGGSSWLYSETLTLTASAAFFAAGDVGNAIVLELGDDTVTFTIVTYSSTTVVTGHTNKTVPAGLRNVVVSIWSKAVDDLSGLDHLEGKTVAILADGHVITNGHDDPAAVVTAGAIPTLARPYSVIHVGLPIAYPEIETLELEVLGGETLLDKRRLIPSVTVMLESSRGIFAGPDEDHLREWKQRTPADLEAAIPLATEQAEILMTSTWNNTGRILLRQRDPLPLTILMITPNGEIGG